MSNSELHSTSNKELIERELVIVGKRMVELYRRNRMTVATICDEQLDRSGNLLGYIREAALATQSPVDEGGR